MGQKTSKRPLVNEADTDALNLLQGDISWHCRKALEKKEKWEYFGNEDFGYFCKEFPPNSSDYNRVTSVFSLLGGDNIPIKRIMGIYNPSVVGAFANSRKLMEEKANSKPWNISWKDDDNEGLRENTIKIYSQKVSTFSWNKNSNVPIIPAVHGTGLSVAKEISKTGFAALASLDSGYFGKGIYFTTSVHYTLPYSALQENPSVIISFIVPGNVFPIIENHRGPSSLAGKPLRTPGYHSHYVLTNKDGYVLESKSHQGGIYDEIVIPEESQIMPSFIIELENGDQLKSQQELFQRDIVQN